jgi:hypothetical protein
MSRQYADEVVRLQALDRLANRRAANTDLFRQAFFGPMAAGRQLQGHDHFLESPVRRIGLRLCRSGNLSLFRHVKSEILAREDREVEEFGLRISPAPLSAQAPEAGNRPMRTIP